MSRLRVSSYIRNVPFFSRLSADNVALLADVMSVYEYSAGAVITRQADLGSTFFIVVEGHCIIRRVNEDGRLTVPEGERLKSELRPGDTYGETSLFSSRPRDATVTTTVPTRVLVLRRDDFAALWQDVPSFRRQVSIPNRILDREPPRLFDWLEPDETVLYYRRRHWVVFVAKIVLPTLFYLAACSVWLALWRWLGRGMVASPLWALTGLVVLAPIVLWHYVDWRNDYLAVTTRRVLLSEKIALIYESISESSLSYVQNIQVTTSLWGRVLGYGTLTFASAAQVGAIEFDHAPDPEALRDVLYAEVGRAQATQRALQRRAIGETLAELVEIDLGEVSLDRDVADGEVLIADGSGVTITQGAITRALRWLADSQLIPSSRIEANGEVTWRKHWLFLMGAATTPFAATILVTILAVMGFFGWPAIVIERVSLYAGIVLVGAVLCWGWLAWVFEDWANDLYTVTADRIIDIEKHPFGKEVRNEARLADIQNIRTRVPGFWAILFGYGSVLIQTAGSEDFTFDNVPNPKDVQRVISRKVQDYLDRDAAHKAAERREEMGEWFSVWEELRRRRDLGLDGGTEVSDHIGALPPDPRAPHDSS